MIKEKNNNIVGKQVREFFDFIQSTEVITKKTKNEILDTLGYKKNILNNKEKKNKFMTKDQIKIEIKKILENGELNRIKKESNSLKTKNYDDLFEELWGKYLGFLKGKPETKEINNYLKSISKNQKIEDIQLPINNIDIETARAIGGIKFANISLPRIKTITPEVAKELVKLQRGDLTLGIKTITLEIAKKLAKLPNGNLKLPNIEKINGNAHGILETLGGLKNGDIKLGIKKIDPTMPIQALNLKEGDIYLNKLNSLSPEDAKKISGFFGKDVYLNNLKKIDKETAESLSGLKYKQELKKYLMNIHFKKIKKEKEISAQEFKKNQEYKQLEEKIEGYIEKIINKDPEFMEYFTKVENGNENISADKKNSIINDLIMYRENIRGMFKLNRIQKYGDNYSELHLNGLESINKDIAKALAWFKGGDLYLNGLKIITPEIAKELIKLKNGDLHLRGLTNIDEKTINILNKFKNNVILSDKLKLKFKKNSKEIAESKPRVSIITPSHKPYKLKKIIPSVLDQSFGNFERIIVDDTKTKKESENLKRIVEETNDYRIHLISADKNSSGTISKLRNQGLKKAKGEYIAFLDQDDLWHKSKIKLQIKYLKKHKDVAGVGNNVVNMDDNCDLKSYAKYKEVYDQESKELIAKMPSLMSATMLRKDTLEKNKDENGNILNEKNKYTDDYELFHRLILLNEEKIGNIQKDLTYYTLGSNNTTSKNQDEMTKEAFKTILKILFKRFKKMKDQGKLNIHNIKNELPKIKMAGKKGFFALFPMKLKKEIINLLS